MRSWIDHAGEVVWDPSPSLITQLVEGGQPFWLDIEDPTDQALSIRSLEATRSARCIR